MSKVHKGFGKNLTPVLSKERETGHSKGGDFSTSTQRILKAFDFLADLLFCFAEALLEPAE
jgi:hypothetical protein